MKIAFLIGGLNIMGGYERIVVDKANALCTQEDIEVGIVCTHSVRHEPVYKLDPRVKIHYVDHIFSPFPKLFGLGLPVIAVQYALWRKGYNKACRKVLADNGYEVAVVPMHDPSDVLGMKNCISIYESHFSRKTYEKNCIMPWFRRMRDTRFASEADVFVCITKGDTDNWPEAKHIRIITNFTDAKPVAPYNPESKRIVAIGRLEHEKGFDILINAWRMVDESFPDWRLDIYGTGNRQHSLQKQINKAGLNGKITLHGLSHNIPKVFSESAALVMSSRTEGFGLVMLEAFTCGVPIVSFDCDYGPAEIINDNLNGILVPYRNLRDRQRPEALADGLKKIISDAGLRRRMSAEAVKRAADFSRESYLRFIMPFLKSPVIKAKSEKSLPL